MPKSQVTEFIEKFFSDDAFVEEAIKKTGGLPNERSKDNKNFVLIGKANGYDFTEGEFDAAIQDFFRSKGFAGFRKLIHAGRLMMKVNKRLQKEAKN